MQRSASSGRRMPFTNSLRGQSLRSQLKSSQLKLASICRLITAAWISTSEKSVLSKFPRLGHAIEHAAEGPRRIGDAVLDQPGCIVHVQAEVVAQIAFAVAVHPDIGREHEGGIASRLGATDHLLRELALDDIELEPEVALGCGCHVLDRGIRGSRQHEGDARPLGRAGEQNVALRPKRAVQAGGPDYEGGSLM